jgi:hypothetical protein
LTVETSDGIYTSPFPATLFITPTSLELRIQAGREGESWGAIGAVAPSDANAGTGTLTISTDPISDGLANVIKQGASGSVQATTGSLSFHFAKGAIAGEVAGASPPSLNAELSGALSVECWVPVDDPSVTGQTGGIVSDDGTPVLVLDEKFGSTLCKDYGVWAP